MFKKIVVALDGSDKGQEALKKGIELAKRSMRGSAASGMSF